MRQCHGCDRHVDAGEGSCPFCGAELQRTRAAAPRLATVLIGLALAGCGDVGDPGEDTTGTAAGTDASTTAPSSGGSMSVTQGDDTSTSWGSDSDAAAATYGGPTWETESDSWSTTGMMTATETGDDTSTESATGSETGTSTGTSTSTGSSG